MTLNSFLHEFTSDHRDRGTKVYVCSEGLAQIRDIIQRNGLRGCCADRHKITNGFGTTWTLLWAVKEWAVHNGKTDLEMKMWHAMGQAQYARTRDARWAMVKQAAKDAGITNYSFKRKYPGQQRFDW